MATEILETKNPKNRNISERTVQSYASDMKNGGWTLTHQGIAFDTDGNLQDGQHRLWAIIFSGCTIQINVTRGVPVEIDGHMTMDAIDRNRVRSTGQQMGLCHNIKNGNVVAAAMRSIAGMINPKQFKGRLSTANSLELYDLYGKDVEALLNIATGSQYRKSYLLAPLTVYHKGEVERSCDFIQELVSLENMGTQTRSLKKFMDGRPSIDSDISIIRVVSNAIHAFHIGKPTTRLQENDNGREFLIGMFPSTTKKIIELTTPCRVVIPRQKRHRTI